jgi:hypothetical protein
MPACEQRSPLRRVLHAAMAGTNRASPAIRKEATEILLIPVQELEMVRIDFGRPNCYYRQPDIAREFRGSDGRLYNLQFGRMRLPDNEPAVIVYIEPE